MVARIFSNKIIFMYGLTLIFAQQDQIKDPRNAYYFPEPEPPAEITVRAIIGRELEIVWLKPNGAYVIGYYIQYRINSTTVFKENSKLATEGLNYTIKDLEPYQWYQVSVLAYNIFNTIELRSEPKVANLSRTLSEEPPPVSKVKVDVLSHNQVKLSWKIPPPPWNGELNGYIIRSRAIPGNIAEIRSSMNKITLLNMIPYTEYEINITAFNLQHAVSTEPMESTEESKILKTTPYEPGEPTTLSWEFINQQISLSWEHPEEQNGPINGYNIVYRLLMPKKHDKKDDLFKTITVESNSVVLNDTLPWRLYFVEIRAFNFEDDDERKSKLMGKSAFLNLGASQDGVPANISVNLHIIHIMPTKVDIFIPGLEFQESQKEILSYALLVGEGEALSVKGESGYEDDRNTYDYWTKENTKRYLPTPFDWEPFNSDNTTLKCAKHLKGLKCTIGDGDCKESGYCNGPLRKNSLYRVKFRIYTLNGWAETNAMSFQTGGEHKMVSSSSLLITFFLLLQFK